VRLYAGGMYFFKDDSYYLFSGKKLDVEPGYPRLINDKWTFCSEDLQQLYSTASVGLIHVNPAQQFARTVRVTVIVCVGYIFTRQCL